MRIKSIAIGNKEESFIENRLTEKINIIFSDDNNRGKTIVMQGLMYALGNSPIFPNSFPYQNYYYIIDFEVGNKTFYVCRKNNSFLIKDGKELNICDTVSDFKRYFDSKIYKLPEIIKDNKTKIVDPELFLQLFFLGQDRKDTSNIFNTGYYKKEDFLNMLLSMAGIYSLPYEEKTQDEISERIKILTAERKELLNKYKILKKVCKSLAVTNYTNDKTKFDKTITILEEIKNRIVELKNERNRIINRKLKNEEVLKIMASLNRSLDVGKVICGDCGSENIKFISASQDYAFDISSIEIRQQVKQAIENKIIIFSEEIEKLNAQINDCQQKIKEELKETDITIEDVLLLKSDITLAAESDDRIKSIDIELDALKILLNKVKGKQEIDDKKAKIFFDNLLSTINTVYKKIDPTGNLNIDSLFSKRDMVYSGSEETEFYLCKLISFLICLNHPFPIVIDAFREGELSTKKENVVLDIFNKFNNQIILTATLKEQEIGKYNHISWVNKLDYSIFQASKLLQSKYNTEFNSLMERFQK